MARNPVQFQKGISLSGPGGRGQLPTRGSQLR